MLDTLGTELLKIFSQMHSFLYNLMLMAMCTTDISSLHF